MHLKGYAAPETKAAAERARLLIEQAEALGEPLEDPLLLFSVLYGLWVANAVAFNGAVLRELAEQFLALAEKQAMVAPRMVGHRLMGTSPLLTGEVAAGRAHFDRALALYDPTEHRPLATRFGQDVGVAILSFRSLALWLLGYPDAALADANHALKDAREIGQAATLMYALNHTAIFDPYPLRKLHRQQRQLDELIALADEKGASYWKALGNDRTKACVLALTGKASDAIQMFTPGSPHIDQREQQSVRPLHLSYLARAYAEARSIR